MPDGQRPLWPEMTIRRKHSAHQPAAVCAETCRMSPSAGPIRRKRRVAGALAWVLFSLAWVFVLRRDPKTWLPELIVPLIAAVAVTALTSLWVRHNIGIYRRKGPRRTIPAAPTSWQSDTLGRPLRLTAGAGTARVVTVSVADGCKHYRVEA
ncbi:MAG TPA: hypothetical protein VFT62_04620 [Mycobacteriales bacterium]|nr:hypothetical protein [Mycobacteriales bacterium]